MKGENQIFLLNKYLISILNVSLWMKSNKLKRDFVLCACVEKLCAFYKYNQIKNKHHKAKQILPFV